MAKAVPVTDEEGMTSSNYTFTLKNNEDDSTRILSSLGMSPNRILDQGVLLQELLMKS